MYYRGAAAAIVVYDITQANSFKTLKNWVEELKTKGPKDIAIAIAGNKADLEHLRVSFDHISNFVSSLIKNCNDAIPHWHLYRSNIVHVIYEKYMKQASSHSSMDYII